MNRPPDAAETGEVDCSGRVVDIAEDRSQGGQRADYCRVHRRRHHGQREPSTDGQQPDLQVVAVCDVDEWRLNDANTRRNGYAKNETWQLEGCMTTNDLRQILARPDIDAVLIATGDRWHAVISTMAAKAGRDVYCEKPVPLTIHESRVMVHTFRRHDRILEGGYQQRSEDDFAAARRLSERPDRDAEDHLLQLVRNEPGPQSPGGAHTSGLDSDMSLGPAPYHPFNSRYHPIDQRGSRTVPVGIPARFRGRQHHVNGVHDLDIAQWVMGMDDTGPVEIVRDARASNHHTSTPTASSCRRSRASSIPSSRRFRRASIRQRAPCGRSCSSATATRSFAGRQGPLKASNPAILAT